MPLRTIKIEGKLTNEHTTVFQFPLGTIESVMSGRWQFAFASITFFVKGDLAWNSVFEISSNYIDSVVPTDTGRVRKQMPLTIIRLKGTSGDKIFLGFRCRDFFDIITPTPMFSLTWTELHPDPSPMPSPTNSSKETKKTRGRRNCSPSSEKN